MLPTDPFTILLLDSFNSKTDIPFFVNRDWLLELQKYCNTGIIDPTELGAFGPIIIEGDDAYSIVPQPDCGPAQTQNFNGGTITTNTSLVSVGSEIQAYSALRSVQDANPITLGVPAAVIGGLQIGQMIKISTYDNTGYLTATISNIVYSSTSTAFGPITLNNFYYISVTNFSVGSGSGNYYSWLITQVETVTTSTQSFIAANMNEQAQRIGQEYIGKTENLFPTKTFYRSDLDQTIRGGSSANGAGGPWATGGLSGPSPVPGNAVNTVPPVVSDITTFYELQDQQKASTANIQAAALVDKSHSDPEVLKSLFGSAWPVYHQGLA